MSETAVAEPENAVLLALIDEHFREFKERSIVNCTILDIRPQVVVVDIGYKSEGENEHYGVPTYSFPTNECSLLRTSHSRLLLTVSVANKRGKWHARRESNPKPPDP